MVRRFLICRREPKLFCSEKSRATPTDHARASADSLADAFRKSGASFVSVAVTEDQERSMWRLRHAASPILSTLGPSLTSMQFIEDCAVPPARLPDYVRGVREIFAKHDVKGVIFGHAGDSHVHVNPLIDVTRPDWRDTVAAMLREVVSLAARLGGTLDAEHGDGRLRTPLLPQVWPPEVIERFAQVKTAFDPMGIFNPGVKVATPHERPITEIKYDPALPPLPARAAAALARVSAASAYSSFRLDLLEGRA